MGKARRSHHGFPNHAPPDDCVLARTGHWLRRGKAWRHRKRLPAQVREAHHDNPAARYDLHAHTQRVNPPDGVRELGHHRVCHRVLRRNYRHHVRHCQALATQARSRPRIHAVFRIRQHGLHRHAAARSPLPRRRPHVHGVVRASGYRLFLDGWLVLGNGTRSGIQGIAQKLHPKVSRHHLVSGYHTV